MDKSMDTYSEATKKIINYMNCPYQTFTSNNTPEEVEEAYKQAAERGKKEGFTPLLLVSSDTLADTLEYSAQESYSKEEIIQQQEMDAEKMLQEWYEEMAEDYIEMDAEEMQRRWREETGEELEEYGEEINEFSSLSSYTHDGIEETILVEIPVKNPWEVIAWVPMGGWNECPAADEMMEVCRYWHKKYGAVPALISSDSLEFALEKPISDENEARQAAKEHYAFCHDRIDQGTETGTIDELANCISKSTVWFFWWD